ncbi:hypothetical protein RHSIM_Rhsim01G0074200 [Rhododendron simsii]|uniref:Uncharacterized protein n=1 Tax=Rhododendron simsii TaxID=118357 RepID=A0A834LZK0_RHOSS|nr:hypothetical protein RHSIM_Rhsim01G0074200 [Rhododendron simsii]
MGRRRLQGSEDNGGALFSNSGIGFLWSPQDEGYHPGGLFASVGQMGMGFGVTPNSSNTNESTLKLSYLGLYSKYMLPQPGFQLIGTPEVVGGEVEEIEDEVLLKKKKKKGGLRLRIKIGNPSLRRLISGAIAGAVSRTSVAPLETIRTHLMVGSCGHSSTEVFQDIMKNEGWTGLFRGNLVNVIRVAPSKAIERGAYKNLLDAFVKIVQEEGPAELYRGLTPSLIGVIPYAATNYFAYDMLRKAYRKVFKKDDIGNIATLLIGSAAGAISSTATFPLEVARKHMQAGALNGRQYKNMLHALVSILEHEGLPGMYRGLGPSCIKIIPAAGISFMCYEACKKILVEDEDDV